MILILLQILCIQVNNVLDQKNILYILKINPAVLNIIYSICIYCIFKNNVHIYLEVDPFNLVTEMNLVCLYFYIFIVLIYY